MSLAGSRNAAANIGAAEAVLNSLPHAVVVIGPDAKIVDANVAAEAFFEVSVSLLRRHVLRDLVPFGSPLLTLIDQVRRRGAAVNEYRVDLSTPRNPGERIVDQPRHQARPLMGLGLEIVARARLVVGQVDREHGQ